MSDEQEFSRSSNGDRWYIVHDAELGEPYVLHRANPSSGGHETRTPVEVFLNIRAFGPERETLLDLLSRSGDASTS